MSKRICQNRLVAANSLLCLLSAENRCLKVVIWVLERERSRPGPYQVNTLDFLMVFVRWYCRGVKSKRFFLS